MNKHIDQISTRLIQMIFLPYTVMASEKKSTLKNTNSTLKTLTKKPKNTNLKNRKDTWHADRSLFLHTASDFPYR